VHDKVDCDRRNVQTHSSSANTGAGKERSTPGDQLAELGTLLLAYGDVCADQRAELLPEPEPPAVAPGGAAAAAAAATAADATVPSIVRGVNAAEPRAVGMQLSTRKLKARVDGTSSSCE
jgi:hypothetical protein